MTIDNQKYQELLDYAGDTVGAGDDIDVTLHRIARGKHYSADEAISAMTCIARSMRVLADEIENKVMQAKCASAHTMRDELRGNGWTQEGPDWVERDSFIGLSIAGSLEEAYDMLVSDQEADL